MPTNLNHLPSVNIPTQGNIKGRLLKSWINSYKTSCRLLTESLGQNVLNTQRSHVTISQPFQL